MAKRSKKKQSHARTISAGVAASSARARQNPLGYNREWLWGAILVLAVILAYSPVWWAGFVWDDDTVVTANPVIIGPLGLREIWSTSAADICPFTLTTFWLEHALWGLHPLPYHLVNVCQHAVCAVLLWRVLRTLLVPGAWLGAALWALHPVQTESVAWITEMKNTESCLFYLLSILFFLKELGRPAGKNRKAISWNYALTMVFAALAMASKSSTVILPMVLCLCAWWMEGRWQWRNSTKIIPIFLFSIVAGVATALTQWHQMGTASQNPSWPERLITAGDAVWFYLGKLLWPRPLVTVYPRWQIDTGNWLLYMPLLAVMIVSFVLWRERNARLRPHFFAWTYFLMALLPILGLLNGSYFRYSQIADHFQYLASMGPLAFIGAGMAWLADVLLPARRWLQSILGAGVLVILGALSWLHAWCYESDETLWTTTLALDSNSWVAYNHLGNALMHDGRVDDAIEDYQKAIEINARYVDAYNNLGNALTLKGQPDAAIALFQKALEINPNHNGVHYDLGNALAQKGELDEAIAEYRKALDDNPDYTAAHINLGNALTHQGRMDEALAEFQKAIEVNPNSVEAINDLGLAYLRAGQIDQAIAQYRKALEFLPNSDLIHCNLGNALLRAGQVDDAIAEYRKVLELNPDHVEAANNLGMALLQKGQIDEATAQFRKALQLKPDYAMAKEGLAKAGEMARQKAGHQ